MNKTLNTVKVPTAGEILRGAFVRKLKSNPAFSLRAFARRAGVSPAYISQVLNDRKLPSAQRAAQLAKLLGLTAQDSDALLSALDQSGTKSRTAAKKSTFIQYYDLAVDQFTMISDWYHAAIMDLTTTKNFRPDPRWIAGRLGLTPAEVKEAAARLERLGLLKIGETGWKKTKRKLEIQTKSSLAPIRQYHKQNLQKAIVELEKTDQDAFTRRSITGLSLAMNPAQLPKARVVIDQCLDQLAALLSSGDCTEVYQLSIQLFPLTQNKSVKGSRNV